MEYRCIHAKMGPWANCAHLLIHHVANIREREKHVSSKHLELIRCLALDVNKN